MGSTSDDLSRLLLAAGEGDATATEAIVALVYDELRALARAKLRGARPGATLQPTMLVHDVYLKLFGGAMQFESRRHFFFAAGRAMKDVLCERARKRARRDALHDRVVEERMANAERSAGASGARSTMLAISEALPKLQAADQRAHDVVTLRFFAGLPVEQVAELLGITSRTVERDWKFARSWLYAELKASGEFEDFTALRADDEADLP